jgi:hypothetical protein
MARPLVIVESPAKAKTINKYLGPGYHVIASFGHVRDLPPKDGSVRPDDDFDMDWEVDSRAEGRLKEIAQAVKSADKLILATDPDREGEAISWHIAEELRRRKALGGIEVKRVVFNEVTKGAVLDAMKNPRELNHELVEAYLARRALDYLVGFTLSPVLWRKLPGSKSAGRVQSVALRIICEREAEIEVFKPREYWSIEALFKTAAGDEFKARLTHLDGKKQLVNPFDNTVFPNNRIPISLFDPAARKVLSFAPVVSGGFLQAFGASPRDSILFMARNDINLGPRQTLYIHYYYNRNTLAEELAYGTNIEGWTGRSVEPRTQQNAGINHTFAVSPTLLNQLTLGFTRSFSFDTSTVTRPPADFGIDMPQYTATGSPQFVIFGRVNIRSGGQVKFVSTAYQIQDHLSIIRNQSHQSISHHRLPRGWEKSCHR